MRCQSIAVLLLVALCHADDLIDEINAERVTKASIAADISKNAHVQAALNMPKELSLSQREVEKTSMLIQTAADEAKDAVAKAQKKVSDANAMEKEAEQVDTSGLEESLTKEADKSLKKMDWEVSFLQQEMDTALRKRDQSFVQKEISKLQADREQITKSVKQKVSLATVKKQELRNKAYAAKSQAEAELDEANHVFTGVEAIGQQVEEWSHKVPSWMVQSQLEQARISVSQQQTQAAELKELNAKKRALWEVQGKELTCSAAAPGIQTFLMDSKRDNSANVDCLEKQLNKYCLNPVRAPTMNAKHALQLVGVTDECLPNGIDQRVPAEQRGAVGSRWCSIISLLQAVTTQAKKAPYFLVLEDDISVDHKEFEETISSFAQTYKDEPWDLLQIDPFGTHSERDEDMVPHFKGLPVFRNSRHGQYFGFHTVLVKSASAPRILQKMMSMPAVPLDSLPTLMNEEACDVGGCRLGAPSALALQAFISETPKADQAASALVERSRVPKACQTEVPQGLSELEASSWTSLVQVLSKADRSANVALKSKKKVKTLARGFGASSKNMRANKVINLDLKE